MIKNKKIKRILGISYYWLILLTLVSFILGAVYLYRHFDKIISLFNSWRTLSRIVVFESDDWGKDGLSQSVLKKLSTDFDAKDFLIPLMFHCDLHWLRDALETEDDLDRLYSILEKYTDCRGRHPVFTANIIVANPDFAAIRNNNFQSYISLKPSIDLIIKWKEGINRGVFFPQYHGYTHFNYQWWLRDLRNNDYFVKKLFDLGVARIPSFKVGQKRYDYGGEYVDLSVSPSKEFSYEEQQDIVRKGMDTFEGIFGYKSLTTIAPFYLWDENTEKAWQGFGIKYIQGSNYHIIGYDEQKEPIRKRYFLGQINRLGQVYLLRTCSFEEFGGKIDAWKSTMKEISRAFKRDYPAIINAHRVNYVSSVDPKMQDLAFAQLDILLRQIEKKFPDVIYLTSAELGELIETGTFHDFATGEIVTLPDSWFSHYRWLFKSWEFQISVAIICVFLILSIFLLLTNKRTKN